MKPAVRYYGSKWLLARWLIPLMRYEEVFIDGFGGSASILLQRSRVRLEVYNDIDDVVYKFFRVLRDNENGLIEAIWKTPYSLREYERCIYEDDLADVEIARRFYVRSYMSINGNMNELRTGWRRQKTIGKASASNGRITTAAETFANVDKLYCVAARLRGVQIDNLEIFELFERYDQENVMWYLDPPYLMENRKSGYNSRYRHEFEKEDHKRLLNRIKKLKGYVMISSYDNELYNEKLKTWQMRQKEVRTNGAGRAMEKVWMNYGPERKQMEMELYK